MRKRAKILVLLAIVFSLIISSAVMGEDGKEFVTNGDFTKIGANGMPNGWSVGGWINDGYTSIVEYDESNGCVRIVNNSDNDFRLYQDISVKKNSYYLISCDVKTSNIVGAGGANISVINSFAGSESLKGTNSEWTTLSFYGKTAARQTKLTLAVRLGGYGATCSGEAWFDNASVRLVDEVPAGAAVLDLSSDEYEGNLSSGETENKKGTFESGQIYAWALLLAVVFVVIYRNTVMRETLEIEKSSHDGTVVAGIIFVAFVMRLVLAVATTGYETDINCFTAWGRRMVNKGTLFYSDPEYFCDYPPLYMCILGLMSLLTHLFESFLGASQGISNLFVKLPAIIADMALVFMVYKFAEDRLKPSVKWVVVFVAAFNPVFFHVSSIWGQIDQLLTVLLLCSMLLLIKRKYIIAGVVYGLAISLKPQAFIVGPILAAAYIYDVFEAGRQSKKELKTTLIKTVCAVAAAVFVIAVIWLPFAVNAVDSGSETGVFGWIVGKYINSAQGYKYATIEAYNAFGIFGLNWTDASETAFIFSHGTWGVIGIITSVVFAVILYVRGRNGKDREGSRNALFLCAAVLVSGIFMFGHYMHERYLFPAIVFILMAFMAHSDRRLFIAFCWLSVSMLMNVLGAYIVPNAERGSLYQTLITITGIIGISGYVFLCHTAADILVRKRFHGIHKARE